MSGPISAVSNVAAKPKNLNLEVTPGETGSSVSGGAGASSTADVAQFRAALDRHSGGSVDAVGGSKAAAAKDAGKSSLGDRVMSRATEFSSDIKKEELAVSKSLEQATRTGDTMQLMRAMMAMNDYQLRVQAISKVVSKGISSLDTLTKLQ